MNDFRHEAIRNYLSSLKEEIPFVFLKINHGFWDKVAKIESLALWPSTSENRIYLEKRLALPHFFTSNYFEEFLYLLDLHAHGYTKIDLHASLSAQPRKRVGAEEKNPNSGLIQKHLSQASNPELATLMKFACETGEIVDIFQALQNRKVVLVAPYLITQNAILDGFNDVVCVEMSYTSASAQRWKIIEEIEKHLIGQKNPVILIQAGTMSVFLGIVLAVRYPNLTILDMGIALGSLAPEALIADPWVWQTVKGMEIFGSTKRLASNDLNWPDKKIETFSQLAKLTFTTRKFYKQEKVHQQEMGRHNFLNRLKELENQMNQIPWLSQWNHLYSAPKFWLSRGFKAAGDEVKAATLLEDSLTDPIKGFHMPLLSLMEDLLEKKDIGRMRGLLEHCNSLYPKEIALVDFAKGIRDSSHDFAISSQIDDWINSETYHGVNDVFKGLPDWRVRKDNHLKVLFERIRGF